VGNAKRKILRACRGKGGTEATNEQRGGPSKKNPWGAKRGGKSRVNSLKKMHRTRTKERGEGPVIGAQNEEIFKKREKKRVSRVKGGPKRRGAK